MVHLPTVTANVPYKSAGILHCALYWGTPALVPRSGIFSDLNGSAIRAFASLSELTEWTRDLWHSEPRMSDVRGELTAAIDEIGPRDDFAAYLASL